ncbi:glycoside hydrolase family 25 protein [Flavobacterium rhizosphaerae]|uniref:Glycoside hydrolase family 25 protein n=1 Tax=Flavobacterium rhizosphaerae TaxID=3163298 RepID=A0ABW8YXB6_9FLAO
MPRNVPKKNIAQKRKPKPKAEQAGNDTLLKVLKFSVYLFMVSCIIAATYNYRHGILYYLGFKTDKRVENLTRKERKIADLRIYEIVERYKDKVFGIDVSHYQGSINWDTIAQNKNTFPIHFIFIRATAGKDGRDTKYNRNWSGASKSGMIRGAYHYYRPDENSIKQADNFIKTVTLAKGDLPPVLDIERIPNTQSLDSLKAGLKRWLNRVEGHYGVKPIIYSGESFYTDFLKEEFKGYKLWIANYSFLEDKIRDEWHFWQFTDKAAINGIDGNVDVNIYNGTMEGLKEYLITRL